MRYACPSCSRVFYLDTKTSSPCPACGTMLAMEEEGAAPAPAADETPVGTDEGSWVMDPGTPAADEGSASWSDETAQLGPSAAPWAAGPEAQEDVGPMPSYPGQEDETISMPGQPAAEPPPVAGLPPLTGFGAQPAAAPAGTDEGSGAYGGPGGAPEAAAPPAEPSPAPFRPDATAVAGPSGLAGTGAWDRPAPSGAMVTGRVPAPAPSGSHVFLITSIVVLLVGGAAAAAIYFFGPEIRSFMPRKDKGGGEAAEKKVAELEERLSETENKLKEAQQDAFKAKESLQAAKLELEEFKRKSGDLGAGLARRSEAAGHAASSLTRLERRSDLVGALKSADEALTLDPDFVLALRVRGRALLALGRGEEAVAAFLRADKAAQEAGAPGDVEALVLAGEACLSDLGDEKRAREHYGRAVELDPKGALGLAAAARALQLEGKPAEAAAKAAEARKAAPSLAIAPLIQGEIAFSQALKEKDSARKAALGKADGFLAEALKLDPNSARVCLIRGRLLLERAEAEGGSTFTLPRLGFHSRAERLLATATRLKPASAEGHMALAELRLREGALWDPATARVRAGEAVRLTKKKSAPALALFAEAQAATGNPASAVQTIKEAIQIDPKNGEYVKALRRYEKEERELRR